MMKMTLVKLDAQGNIIDTQTTGGFADDRTYTLLKQQYQPRIRDYEARPDTAQVQDDKPMGIVAKEQR